ncbi:MAG: hypothetical protein L0228_14120 [Planctomycetes bacterium]|nr:hypothetical protein [Planctomycetota bacterium]
MKWESLHRFVASAVLLAAGMAAGAVLQFSNTAWGEVRTGPPPTAFQSGSQLSVPILKEIAATLHQMDGRLARLETVAQKLQATKSGTQR